MLKIHIGQLDLLPHMFLNFLLHMPLGIGQSQQYGFYKKINRWSSTYDDDIVEEISNYERLINGNIDFSFLVIFSSPNFTYYFDL